MRSPPVPASPSFVIPSTPNPKSNQISNSNPKLPRQIPYCFKTSAPEGNPWTVHDGPIVDEVRQKFDSWIYQIVRLCANSREVVSSPVEHLDSGQTKGQNGTGHIRDKSGRDSGHKRDGTGTSMLTTGTGRAGTAK
ncbi:hypothetical protein L6164_023489 [Bauhinia variegata]|uniref:Uncharacterized protein n=1 Tax=Bauhinia variegata TaxID=167791 RepID=A0ACB9MIS9_BAUVA|nr:hypothetical protein L6164_023489 [Bauhinia variegata]